MNRTVLLAAVLVILPWNLYSEQTATTPQRTILAVGAHAGDMEISCGAVLAKHAKMGDRVVLLHLTLGERGNPRITSEEYGRQKKAEAEAAAKILGAEVLFGPYKDAELPNDELARKYVADVIRQLKPSHIITHWKRSLHRDHASACAITTDALLLASLPGFPSVHPPHRGVRNVYFTENWEDKETFSPYAYVDVSDAMETWEKCVKQYEFIRGGVSSFPYFDYYKSLARVRGSESGFHDAVSFDVAALAKRQILRSLP